MEFFLKSLGISNEVIQHLDETQLAFQRPALLGIGLLLLIPAGYYLYRRQREHLNTVPAKVRIALNATRLAILFILVVVLAGPYLKLDLQIVKKPILAVLLDVSQSMQLPAGPFESDDELMRAAGAAGYEVEDEDGRAAVRESFARLSRAELAAKVIRVAGERLQSQLDDNYDCRYYSFAHEVSPLDFAPVADPSSVTEQVGRNRSCLGEAVYHVLDEAAGRRVSAIVLLTDGQNTGGRSPSEAARDASKVGTPIFGIPLGSSERMRDVSIVDVYTSGLVAVGDTVGVNVTLESQGFDGREVTVRLEDGNQLLDSQVCVVRDAEHQHVELSFEAEQAGARYLKVSVDPLDDEHAELRSNNSDLAFVRVSGEKLRILLIDGLPRWDFRFIKNAIRRDNGLAGRNSDIPDIVVETEWRRLDEARRSLALPQSATEIERYHSIIVGDVSPDLLDSRLQRILIDAVRDKGVGLIVAAGTQAMPHRYDGAFLELLPVRLPSSVAGITAPVYNPYRIEVSPDGVTHETMRLYDDPGRNRNLWAGMPPYFWCAAVETLSAGASVLAWNPNVESQFGKMPLIAHHYAGEGRVLFVGMDSTWLWRQNVGDRFFYKFWGQCLRFVGRREPGETQTSWMEVRPLRAQLGEEAQIELMAFKEDGRPEETPGRMVTAHVGETTRTIQLLADPSKKGRYTGRFTPDTWGRHRLRYQSSGNSPQVEADIHVLASQEEFRHPNLNRSMLELLSQTTGGEVVAVDGLEAITDRVRGDVELRQLHREATIWDNWLTLTLLILVYSIDVAVRRMMGLS